MFPGLLLASALSPAFLGLQADPPVTPQQGRSHPKEYLEDLEGFRGPCPGLAVPGRRIAVEALVEAALELRAPDQRLLTLAAAASCDRETAWRTALAASGTPGGFLRRARAAEAVSLLALGPGLPAHAGQGTATVLAKSLPQLPFPARLEVLRGLGRVLPALDPAAKRPVLEELFRLALKTADYHFAEHLVWLYRSLEGRGSFSRRLRAEGPAKDPTGAAWRHGLRALDPPLTGGEPLQRFRGEDPLPGLWKAWEAQRAARPLRVSGPPLFLSRVEEARKALERRAPDLARFVETWVRSIQPAPSGRLSWSVKGEGRLFLAWTGEPLGLETRVATLVHEAMHLHLARLGEDFAQPCHTEEERCFEVELLVRPLFPDSQDARKPPVPWDASAFRRALEARLKERHWVSSGAALQPFLTRPDSPH